MYDFNKTEILRETFSGSSLKGPCQIWCFWGLKKYGVFSGLKFDSYVAFDQRPDPYSAMTSVTTILCKKLTSMSTSLLLLDLALDPIFGVLCQRTLNHGLGI